MIYVLGGIMALILLGKYISKNEKEIDEKLEKNLINFIDRVNFNPHDSGGRYLAKLIIILCYTAVISFAMISVYLIAKCYLTTHDYLLKMIPSKIIHQHT
jgi:hypothetical protein